MGSQQSTPYLVVIYTPPSRTYLRKAPPMSRRPDVYARAYEHQGKQHLLICRGYLASILIRPEEAVALANQLIDLVEEGEADGVPTMR